MNALVDYESSEFENCNRNDKPKVEVYDQEQYMYYMLLWLRTVSLAIVIL